MARIDESFWELKESAKWSLDVSERKKAIRLLASYGPEAIDSIAEIKDVAAYDEIKRACIEAIKAASGRKTAPKTRKVKARKSKKSKKSRLKK